VVVLSSLRCCCLPAHLQLRAANRDAALREIKERAKKLKAEKSTKVG
jgi:hypothetical protein